uniref:DoxX family membrane protein n=1 Tax=Streptomyces sp. SBT349 TaxID=1580539 RepID=UPI000A7333D4
MEDARPMASLPGRVQARVARWEKSFAALYGRISTLVLRVSVGIVFLWFGVLKFIPHGSPAEELAIRCTRALSFDLVPPEVCRLLLAILETSIGVGLITGILLRLTLAVFFVHMAGVFTVFVLAPDAIWAEDMPMELTLEGQYVVKNVVLIAACLTVLLHRIRSTASRAPAR